MSLTVTVRKWGSNYIPGSLKEIASARCAVSSRPRDLLQGQSVRLINKRECGSFSQRVTQGKGLKTGLASVSPKRAAEQKGLG